MKHSLIKEADYDLQEEEIKKKNAFSKGVISTMMKGEKD